MCFRQEKHEYKCSCCGFVPKKKDAGIDVEAGDLLEITRKKVTLQTKQKLYSELLHVEMKKGTNGICSTMYRVSVEYAKGLNDVPSHPHWNFELC